MKILAVDDNRMYLRLIRQMLEALGHDVVDISSPIDALTLLDMDEMQYDLIFTDIDMNHINGDEFAKIVKQTKAMPIIALSATIDFVDEDTMQYFDGFLRKPVRLREIKDMLDNKTYIKDNVEVKDNADNQKISQS